MPSRHPESPGLAGGTARAEREKFAFSIAEVTDALALEVLSEHRGKLGCNDPVHPVAAMRLNPTRDMEKSVSVFRNRRFDPMLRCPQGRHSEMKHTQKTFALGLAGIVAVGLTAAGCDTPWFGHPKTHTDAQDAAPSLPGGDQRVVAANYINSLCKLAKEQRDPQVRALNEAVLPNHATISCGPGSGPDP